MRTKEKVMQDVANSGPDYKLMITQAMVGILEVLLDIRDLAIENQKTRFVTYHKDEPDEEGQGAV